MILLLISFGVFILQAYGIYILAKNRDIENAWMAWVPFAQVWLLGSMVVETSVFRRSIRRNDIAFLVINLVTSVGYAMFSGMVRAHRPVGELIAAGVVALLLYACQFIYGVKLYTAFFRQYRPKLASKMAVISWLLGVAGAVFFFVIRNDEQVAPEWEQY